MAISYCRNTHIAVIRTIKTEYVERTSQPCIRALRRTIAFNSSRHSGVPTISASGCSITGIGGNRLKSCASTEFAWTAVEFSALNESRADSDPALGCDGPSI